MTKVKVETVLKHDGKAVGEQYEAQNSTEAAALAALGLVKPANQVSAKAVEKAVKE
jgi:hypothetical protein